MTGIGPGQSSDSRKHRVRRKTVSSPSSLSASPVDSGYGSVPSTPEQLQTPKTQNIDGYWTPTDITSLASGPYIHDGPCWLIDGEEVFSHARDTFVDGATVSRRGTSPRKWNTTTLPKRSTRCRPSLPLGFLSEKNMHGRQRRGSGHLHSRSSSIRNSDRFIPSRMHSNALTDVFRTTKATEDLTALEKILRNERASADAFCFRRRVVTPIATGQRTVSQSETLPPWTRVGTVLGALDQNSQAGPERHVSPGSVWSIGGIAPSGTAVNNGRGQFVNSGTNAPLFRTSFSTVKPKAEEDLEKHEARLASALGLDRTQRVLGVTSPFKVSVGQSFRGTPSKTTWSGTEWVNDSPMPKPPKPAEIRTLPVAPFKVLDAPNLRDDFYCSMLAYSPTCRTLAVSLGNLLYGWSESNGVRLLNGGAPDNAHLTSVAFSSTSGRKSILAYGRSNRTLGLMSFYDTADPSDAASPILPRFEVLQPAPVSCLSWRPTCTTRTSAAPYNSQPETLVKTEDLLVGDDTGHVYYYSVEWPARWEVERFNWPGVMKLKARISIHTQQVCGLAWSWNGELFATGSNDNLCCLFQASKVLREGTSGRARNHSGRQDAAPGSASLQDQQETGSSEETAIREDGTQIRTTRTPIDSVRNLKAGDEKHKWTHGAAVKAIAFCPWQDGLVATGGGSNDKCIHFFHTTSGAALATISVCAQVTSLIWSTTRREIAATFGYAQPEHPIRIAVFSWPDCRQVAAIPWAGEHRALYAVPYPNGPSTLRTTATRTATEGCIMVASSDKSVKFHEVWSADKRATVGGARMLGGSDILDDLEGISKEGDVIR